MKEQDSKIPVITLQNVVYNYRDYDENGEEILTQRGVNDLSLTVYQGEFLAIIHKSLAFFLNIAPIIWH